jgi:ketosteroid isomerase-like protein
MGQQRPISSLVVLLIAVSLMLAKAEQRSVATQTGEPLPDFASIMQRVLDAWSTLEPANAARYYAPEPDHVFYDFAPMEYQGWAAYADGVRKAGQAYSFAKITLGPDVRVHSNGNLAWATATWHMSLVRKEGTKEAMDGRWTVLWEKRGQDWLIVHEHFSVPLH